MLEEQTSMIQIAFGKMLSNRVRVLYKPASWHLISILFNDDANINYFHFTNPFLSAFELKILQYATNLGSVYLVKFLESAASCNRLPCQFHQLCWNSKLDWQCSNNCSKDWGNQNSLFFSLQMLVSLLHIYGSISSVKLICAASNIWHYWPTGPTKGQSPWKEI